jgi:phage baseplate assembly protein W
MGNVRSPRNKAREAIRHILTTCPGLGCPKTPFGSALQLPLFQHGIERDLPAHKQMIFFPKMSYNGC